MFYLRACIRTAALFCVAVVGLCGNRFVVGQEAGEKNLSSTTSLKILSYNIHHGRGQDDQVNLARIAEVIKASRPDVVALQEVDDRTRRTNLIRQTEVLARLVEMDGLFVHQIDFEGGRYGQAILSRFPMANLQLHWLPGTPDRERRMAGAVTISLGSRDLLFVTTHLHHANDSIRKSQAEQLNQIFASGDAANHAVVLAGDLNAMPESETLQILGKRWESATAGRSDSLTFPASGPNRQLDYVLYRSRTKVELIMATVVDEPIASDHRPLLVELAFED